MITAAPSSLSVEHSKVTLLALCIFAVACSISSIASLSLSLTSEMVHGHVGSVDVLRQVWKILESEGPKIGLLLNPSKCEWSWLNHNKADQCPIDGVDQELVSTAKKFMKNLADFEDTQVGLYLLVHFMRTI